MNLFCFLPPFLHLYFQISKRFLGLHLKKVGLKTQWIRKSFLASGTRRIDCPKQGYSTSICILDDKSNCIALTLRDIVLIQQDVDKYRSSIGL